MGRAPSGSLAVGRELAAIAADAVALAWRVPAYWFESDAARAALLEALQLEPPQLAPAPAPPPRSRWPERPLQVCLSWAEASGEIHARNLVHALREAARAAGAPEVRFSALGSRATAAELGLELIGAPADDPHMGFRGIASALPYYLGLVRGAARHFALRRPDVFVPIDSPSLHVPLGRIARRAGVPVVHFVTPQLWGWAPWRVGRYRSAVDRALSILFFEPAWFARAGVPVTHVGHPIQDELARVPPTRPDETSTLLAVLPGSRASVVKRNLPWMLERVQELAREQPDLRVAVCQGRADLAGLCRDLVRASGLELGVRVETGDLHATLARARAALSVSGTVLLDLLHHRLPTVVVYRVAGRAEAWLGERFLTAPWFASLNLLAGREVVPEFAFAGEGPVSDVSRALRRCYNDVSWRRRCSEGLDLAAHRLGPPGAVPRAAREVLEVALAAPPSSPPRVSPSEGPGALPEQDPGQRPRGQKT